MLGRKEKLKKETKIIYSDPETREIKSETIDDLLLELDIGEKWEIKRSTPTSAGTDTYEVTAKRHRYTIDGPDGTIIAREYYMDLKSSSCAYVDGLSVQYESRRL